MDLERERTGLRTGDRLRLRIGDLLRGLRSLLGGDLKPIQYNYKTDTFSSSNEPAFKAVGPIVQTLLLCRLVQ